MKLQVIANPHGSKVNTLLSSFGTRFCINLNIVMLWGVFFLIINVTRINICTLYLIANKQENYVAMFVINLTSMHDLCLNVPQRLQRLKYLHELFCLKNKVFATQTLLED